MNFSKALEELKAGKKIVRSQWQSGEKYIYLESSQEQIHPYFVIVTTETPALSVFQPTICDLLAEDWIVVDEPAL